MYSQLGFGPVAAAAPAFGPAAPIVLGASVIAPIIGSLLGDLGAGRSEADVIVDIQNTLINPSGTGELDQITQRLVRGPNIAGLQEMYYQVELIAQEFMGFISDSQFTDGRASEQAANTIFPYIDGTCGYQWPPPMQATQANCLSWGDGTPGGVGTNGMLGAIARAILRLGGALPPPLITQGYGSTIPSLAPQGSQFFPWIAQAGTLPVNAPLSQIQPASIPIVRAGFGDTPLALFAGAVALMLLQRRSK
jgi:hypothetical protein